MLVSLKYIFAVDLPHSTITAATKPKTIMLLAHVWSAASLNTRSASGHVLLCSVLLLETFGLLRHARSCGFRAESKRRVPPAMTTRTNMSRAPPSIVLTRFSG